MLRPAAVLLLAASAFACGGPPAPPKAPVDDYVGAELRPTGKLAVDVSVVSALPRSLRIRLDLCAEVFVYAEGGPVVVTADAENPEANRVVLPKGKIVLFSGARHVDLTATTPQGTPAMVILARKGVVSPWPTFDSSRAGNCAYGKEREAVVAILDPDSAVPQPSFEGALTTRFLAGSAKQAAVVSRYAALDFLQGRPELAIPEETVAADEVLQVEDGEGTATLNGAPNPVKGGTKLELARGTKYALATTAAKALFAIRVRALSH